MQHLRDAGEIASGERLRTSHDFSGSSLCNHLAAKTARAGAEIENVICVADGLLVVFNDQHGIAQIAQFFQSLNQTVVVALMKADRGLIQNIEHATQPRADLRGQADALTLAAGERGGVAVQRKISQSDGAEELQPLGDLAADALGHQRLACREAEVDGRRQSAIQRQGSEVGDGQAADLHSQRLRAQAFAAADRAGRGGHVAHHRLAIGIAARLFNAVAQKRKNSVKAGARGLVLGWAVYQQVLLAWGQLLERRLEVDLVANSREVDELEQILRCGTRAETVQQRLRPVGDDLGGIEIVKRTEAVALRTGTKGGVEAEAARLQFGHVEAAVGTGHRRREQLLFPAGDGHQRQSVCQL